MAVASTSCGRQTRADGSLCITGCAPRPGSASRAAPSGARRHRTGRAYRPEFRHGWRTWRKRQQKEDPVLRCQPPGVPRIGPPDKIMQTAREVVFLYEDVSGPFFRIVPLRAGRETHRRQRELPG